MSENTPQKIESKPQSVVRSRRLVNLVITALVGSIVITMILRRESTEVHLKSARRAFQSKNFQVALDEANRAISISPDSESFLIAAAAAVELQEFKLAADLLNQLSLMDTLTLEEAQHAGHLSGLAGATTVYEFFLRKVLQEDSSNLAAFKDLLELLRIEGRNWEAREVLLSLMKHDVFLLEGLVIVGCPERIWIDDQDRELIERSRLAIPEDQLSQMGLILKNAVSQESIPKAISKLENIFQAHPTQPEVIVRLGRLYLDHERISDFEALIGNPPPEVERHPGLWVLRGRYLKQRGKTQQAIRAFLETTRRDPDNLPAVFALSQLFRTTGKPRLAAVFAERASQLSNLQELIVYGDGQGGVHSIEIMKKISEQLEQLHRSWEATGWSLQALQRISHLPWALDRVSRLKSSLTSTQSLTSAQGNLSFSISIEQYPQADWRELTKHSDGNNKTDLSASSIRFEEWSASAGVTFQFYNDAHPERGIARMFEFSGGGAAVIDYDNDFEPDLYLTQGHPWPQTADTIYRDHLYRNSAVNESFVECADLAGIDVRGYGQGCSVGDFNNDGMLDLYIAQIGKNRLLKNNGDGTFADVTLSSGVGGDEWTISTVIADFNNDGLPDLYDVNYLTGKGVYSRSCYDEQGPIQCAPTMFASQQDRLFLNRGDGTFTDVTEECGIMAEGGKGMAVIAADFFDEGKIDLFVANDTTANHFFRNKSPSSTDAADLDLPRFEEQGILLGVGLGELGKAQSCMGVAVGDVNSDNKLDLYVTNFIGEPNNLFVQQHNRLFVDQSPAFGLGSSVIPMMSWGTQFLDADLDGDLDLVVANGHLGAYLGSNGTLRMRAQFFENKNSRFEELPINAVGPFFARRQLGRSIATADWNLDGKQDFCLTSVDTAFALLKNQTETSNGYLKVWLRGTKTARDAIGSRIEIELDLRTLSRQLVAGDGFSASNERVLTFGLGDAESVKSIRVKWLASGWENYPGCPANSNVLLLEGNHDLYLLP